MLCEIYFGVLLDDKILWETNIQNSWHILEKKLLSDVLYDVAYDVAYGYGMVRLATFTVCFGEVLHLDNGMPLLRFLSILSLSREKSFK